MLILFLATSCGTDRPISEKTPQPKSNKLVILKENQVILNKTSEFLPYKKLWIPTEKDTEKALDVIVNFLKKPENYNWSEIVDDHRDKNYIRESINRIYNNLSKYRVQFLGVIVDDKKIIYCNFFPNREGDFTYWKEDLVVVMDGGFWFWQVEYDVKTEKCVNLQINGEA